MSNFWIIFFSFLIILAVTTLVRFLRLGEVALEDEAAACAWAEKTSPFFQARSAILSEDGQAALVTGADNQIALVKRHGAHFASRLLGRPLTARQEGALWFIDSGDKQFGEVRMQFDSAGESHLLTMM